MVQWGGGRASKLLSLAAKMGLTWDTVSVQIAMVEEELNQYYLRQINKYLSTCYGISGMSTIMNIDSAAEARAVVYEGCTCINSGITHTAHNGKCSYAANSKSYQHLSTRKAYAQKVYQAMTRRAEGPGTGGPFADMKNSEILSFIFGYGSVKEIQVHYSSAKIRLCCESQYIKRKFPVLPCFGACDRHQQRVFQIQIERPGARPAVLSEREDERLDPTKLSAAYRPACGHRKRV